MQYRLLAAYESLFRGSPYLHRRSNHGDFVASHLFEDLRSLDRSPRFSTRVDSSRSVVNTANLTVGRSARRGDGTFGEAVPGAPVTELQGFRVRRGLVASVEIGVEVKILAKAMIKQIDRVITDLKGQVAHFRSSSTTAVTVAVVGVNHAARYRSYEGERSFETDGKKAKHPLQEAAEAISRLQSQARPTFDEFIILPFRAPNVEPYDFEWVNEQRTTDEYGAALARISREYESRF